MSVDSSHHARKMAVILHADVVDSTRLVQENEVTAHERIQATFQHLSGIIADYGGIAHEIRGDALVAEFKRASDSVCAALAFQDQNTTHDNERSERIQPAVRIGISLGEVVIADGTVTGPGVVLAQRLEQLAQPDGVVVQGTVAETVPTRLPFDFESLGEHILKGFDFPIRAFRVKVTPGETVPEPEAGPGGEPDSGNTRRAESSIAGDTSKPTIAVLPFTNMSGDPEQEYFSDGVTEDIITELSRFGDLFVIARNSSFTFKGQSVEITEIGQKLGVQYIVEGSVRRSGQRARITAQLIDAATGNHVWADRYDRDLEDIFAVQDEVVRIITSTLVSRVAHAHRDVAQRKSTSNHDAYDWFIQGRELFYYGMADENKKAREMFTKAVELDPDYAAAHALLAESYIRDWVTFWSEPLKRSYDQAWANAKKALLLDDGDAQPHTAMGVLLYFDRDLDQARFHLDKALTLNPGDTRALIYSARVDSASGDPERAIARITEARRNNPFAKYDWPLVPAHFAARQYDDAVRIMQSIKNPAPSMLPWMAAIYAHIGDLDSAREMASQFMVIAGDRLSAVGEPLPNNWLDFIICRSGFAEKKDVDHLAEGLRIAGLGD